jgi:Reverse transcriptase (RNA-dependent DNA polymerase)
MEMNTKVSTNTRPPRPAKEKETTAPSNDGKQQPDKMTLPPQLQINKILLSDDDHLHQHTTYRTYTTELQRQQHRIQIQHPNTNPKFKICHTRLKSIMIKHGLQGDTGANIGATNKRELIFDYQTLRQPIPITTYDDGHEEDKCHAIGSGTIKMVDNKGNILSWIMLYTPSSTGTILAPDRYMKDNSAVHSFQHRGHRNGTGTISFHDKNDNEIATINMERSMGLWYTTNKILVPPKIQKLKISPIEHTWQPWMICTKMAIPQNIEQIIRPAIQVNIPLPPPNPSPPTTEAPDTKTTNTPTQTATAALKTYELWHQRLGHPATRTMHKTIQHVTGIPAMNTKHNSGFCCPFCMFAKMRKQKGKTEAQRENITPNSTFHMDLGFIRGPENLQEILKNGETPKQTVIESHDGYTSYLLIIDGATRYIWIFLNKTKNPPIQLIDNFLATHGNNQQQPGSITTSKGGVLEKSKTFQQHTKTQGYTITTVQNQLDIDLEPAGQDPSPHEHMIRPPPNIVKTDNGGELAGSQAFKNTVANHRYIVETTAPEASSQNGKGERPHRTLKEKVRCLLYTAGLGTTFWSDAIQHSAWLYNRTYHTAIDMTPYQAYTNQQPVLAKLLTFGTKLITKKAGRRKNALDPNAYDGIFLGYGATMDNLRYWDTHKQRKRIGRYHQHDELHYSNPPNKRSPAAKHLLETHTGTPNDDRRTHELLDEPQLIQVRKATTKRTHTTTLASHYDMDNLLIDIQHMEITLNATEPAITETIHLTGTHPTLGIIAHQDQEYRDTVTLYHIIPGTIASKNLKRWKSQYRGAIINTIDDEQVKQVRDIARIIQTKTRQRQKSIRIQFAKPHWTEITNEGIPNLNFDQLNVIAHHLKTIEEPETQTKRHPLEWPEITPTDLLHAEINNMVISKLTRRKLIDTEEWPEFEKSEFTQLNKYHKQGMFGAPIQHPPEPHNLTVLPWVWTYLYKIDPVNLDPTAKARGTCNGGKRYGKIITLSETYAACLEQPAHRIFWALTATSNYIAIGTDVANAFGEADAPANKFYMHVDEQFRNWWEHELKEPPIPNTDHIVPVLKNLQGHPEAPRQWHKYIQAILLNDMEFKATTHEPCLYRKDIQYQGESHKIMILRQVDDFIISGPTEELCNEIRNSIQDKMTCTLNNLGIIIRFNGVDILQSRNYIKLSCHTYLDKILDHHQWQHLKAANNPVPMRTDSNFMQDIETSKGPDNPKEQRTLEREMNFNYRQAIGELIFAMTVCRIDISQAVIKLSQYSSQPAKVHYQAVKQIFAYLNATKNDGIYYWRTEPRNDLPYHPNPSTTTNHVALHKYERSTAPHITQGSADATWGADRLHRRSTSGIVFTLAGGAIYYRTRVQPVVALSSTEAELYSMTEAGKAALYIRSILDEMGFPQHDPTPIQADNRGARQLSNAQQPTRRTRHIEIKELVILYWVDTDQIKYTAVDTELNPSDALTKPTGRIKFHAHFDILMGKYPPPYTTQTTQQTQKNNHSAHTPLQINTIMHIDIDLHIDTQLHNETIDTMPTPHEIFETSFPCHVSHPPTITTFQNVTSAGRCEV